MTRHAECTWLYLMRDRVKPKLYKIGISKDPWNRRKQLNRSNNANWTIDKLVHCGPVRSHRFEQQLLKQFDEYRLPGSEFLYIEDPAVILTLKGEYQAIKEILEHEEEIINDRPIKVEPEPEPAPKPIAARITPPGLEPQPEPAIEYNESEQFKRDVRITGTILGTVITASVCVPLAPVVPAVAVLYSAYKGFKNRKA